MHSKLDFLLREILNIYLTSVLLELIAWISPSFLDST
jgi:hypothetical protein